MTETADGRRQGPPGASQALGWQVLGVHSFFFLIIKFIFLALEKLASGSISSASPLLGRPHVVGWAGPAGVFELLGGCLIGKWDKGDHLPYSPLEAYSSEGPF